MGSYKKILLLFILWANFSDNVAYICGPETVPYKFTAYSSDHVVIECAKPACFEVPSTIPIVNHTIYYRSFPYGQEQETFSNFHFSVGECFQISRAQYCPTGTSVLLDDSTKYSNVSVCCKNEHAKISYDNLVSVIAGQEIVGGTVVFQGQQIGFDYISDVTKDVSSSNETKFQLRTRRLNCSDIGYGSNSAVYGSELGQNQVSSRALAANTQVVDSQYQGNQGNARAFAAPNVVRGGPNDVIIIPRPGFSQGQPAYYPTAAAMPNNIWCFSADTEVTMSDGSTKTMDKLQVGDWVASTYNSKIQYSRVKSWIHKLPKQEAEFTKMTLSEGQILKITPQHLIYKTECTKPGKRVKLNKLSIEPIPSDEVKVGDCLYTLSKFRTYFTQTRVENIEAVKETGIYAPLTESGTIVTNKILTSCYSVSDKESLQSNFGKVVKKFNEVTKMLFGKYEHLDEVSLPLSSQMMLEVIKAVLPYSNF